MKRSWIALMFVAALMNIAATPIVPTEDFLPQEGYMAKAGQKLSRGLTNALFGFVLEPFVQAENSHQKYFLESGGKSSFVNYMRGVPLGLERGVQRTFVGVYEVATFLIPQKPIIKPDFILEQRNYDTRPHIRAMAKHPSFQDYDLARDPVYH